MHVDFPRYLKSKTNLDLRSINQTVFARVEEIIQHTELPIKVLELGGGIGSMFINLVEHSQQTGLNYTLIDATGENIARIPKNIQDWCNQTKGVCNVIDQNKIRVFHEKTESILDFIHTTTEGFIPSGLVNPSIRLLIASSYLDIVPVPKTLQLAKNVLQPEAILFLPFNYDGFTMFHPTIDSELDDEIIRLYNSSMDNRRVEGLETGGSLTGRKLPGWLDAAGYQLISAGASDWFVIPVGGVYSPGEDYFLGCIIQFVEDSVTPLWSGATELLESWLSKRRKQIANGELTFSAHQVDYLARLS